MEVLSDMLEKRGQQLPKPTVALVLGSGLGAFADTVEDKQSVSYSDIPTMPQSKVAGHAGNLVFGTVAKTPVVAMQGRVHLYEGHNAQDVVFGLRLMARLGAKRAIITNAAGGIDENLDVGDLMIINDHLNLTGMNPLIGQNEDRLGPRFVDMTTAYAKPFREVARATGQAIGLTLKDGVYAGLLGPTYETPAEIGMLRAMGAHAVGMSTVLEVIAARHMGLDVLGMSCITNKAAGLGGDTLNHEEVQEVANKVKRVFMSLIRDIVPKLESPTHV